MVTWRVCFLSLVAVCCIGGCAAFPISKPSEEPSTPVPVAFDYSAEINLGKYTGQWWVRHTNTPTAEATITSSAALAQGQRSLSVLYCNLFSRVQGAQHSYHLRPRACSYRVQLHNGCSTASSLCGRTDRWGVGESKRKPGWHVSGFH